MNSGGYLFFDRYKNTVLTYWNSISRQFFQKAIVLIISEWKLKFNADLSTRNDSLFLETVLWTCTYATIKIRDRRISSISFPSQALCRQKMSVPSFLIDQKPHKLSTTSFVWACLVPRKSKINLNMYVSLPCWCACLWSVHVYDLKNTTVVHGSPFITLCLGSIELDCVISEPCYKGIISYRNYRKIIIWEPRTGRFLTKTVL